jgi:hypothetical protein
MEINTPLPINELKTLLIDNVVLIKGEVSHGVRSIYGETNHQ